MIRNNTKKSKTDKFGDGQCLKNWDFTFNRKIYHPPIKFSSIQILGFEPKKEENKVNVFTSSFIDSLFSRKNVSSA